MVNHFAHLTAAERYAKYRLYFHPLVVERVRAKLSLAGRVPRALDVACGTGQSAVALAAIADEVIGVDLSAEMLAQTAQHPRVKYQRSAAEALPFGDAGFDLVTIGMGLHWLDQPVFLDEARRVLRPGGWLVVYNQWSCGQMRENPDLATWMRDAYLRRYPTPPRRRTDLDEGSAVAHGFAWQGTETFAYDAALTPEQLVGGLLTQSNTIAAIEEGGQRLAEVAGWLSDAVAPFFSGPTGTFAFAGAIWYAQFVPS